MWHEWEEKNVYMPEGKMLLRRPRHEWVENIKMYIVKIELGGVDWINLAQYKDKCRALVNAVINLRLP
jgi:hypothetical protein